MSAVRGMQNIVEIIWWFGEFDGIATKLTALGTKVTNKTVDSYIKYFCRAFAFYKVKRYDIRGKGYLNTSGK